MKKGAEEEKGKKYILTTASCTPPLVGLSIAYREDNLSKGKEVERRRVQRYVQRGEKKGKVFSPRV